MELRELEAFVAVGTELHFGRAAQRLYISAPSLSELVRRLERELGTTLLTRTTRRVGLTSAGAELMSRAKAILDDVSAAQAAVRRVAGGEAGTVRLGITPPAAPTLAPHLVRLFNTQAPLVTMDVQRMWLYRLMDALAAGEIDVAITCGLFPETDDVDSEVFSGEPLLVGVRRGHRLAGRRCVALAELSNDVLGVPADLFPAWALSHRQALDEAGIAPPTVALEGTDLAAAHWADQGSVEWILLVGSLTAAHTQTVFLPVEPRQLVPFTLQWRPTRASTAAVARFVQTALTADPPPGWERLARRR
ncbi:MAG TPA: LysR family transcriptional regulator [Acidimicrobiales bacterium]|nr:LysR family transcriptional regulator [Acidimicrobiales bacterium]